MVGEWQAEEANGLKEGYRERGQCRNVYQIS